MKKILAGVLAAASMLTMTVSASAASSAVATDKAVSAAGEVEYDVAVTAPKITLSLVLPAKMTAALNPYGADIELKAKTDAAAAVTTSTGIASVAYTITNNSTDYGVYLDATATTTVESADKNNKWKVEAKAVTANTKVAQLALVGAVDADAIKGIADAGIPTESKAFDGTDQGVLVMDSTVAAVTATKTPAGQTKQKKFMFIAAATDEDTPTTAAMAFLGDLGTGDDVEWTEDDAINVALVLKVSAGPKTDDGSNQGGGGGGFTATVDKSVVSWSDVKFVVGNLVANDTYAVNFDASSGNVTPTFTGKTIASTSSSATTIATVRDSDGRISPQADGETTITYNFTDSTSISFKITITNA